MDNLVLHFQFLATQFFFLTISIINRKSVNRSTIRLVITIVNNINLPPFFSYSVTHGMNRHQMSPNGSSGTSVMDAHLAIPHK